MRTIILIREIHTTEEYNVMPASKTFLNVKNPNIIEALCRITTPCNILSFTFQKTRAV